MGATELTQMQTTLNQFGDAIRSSVELGRATLDEIKRTNDTLSGQLKWYERELNRMQGELEKNNADHNRFYARVNKLEVTCGQKFGISVSRDGINDYESKNQWAYYNVGKIVVYVLTGTAMAAAGYIVKMWIG